MQKSAIILGATGLTGSLVLKQLLSNESYTNIKLFSRTSCGIQHSKLEEHLVDVLHLENVKSVFTADQLFCCIGTTKKKTPDPELYSKIDFGIPAEAAMLCKENNIPVMAIVSAIGADSKSKIFYNRTKGKMEDAVQSAGIERTYILRPSIIYGGRKEKRSGEKMGIAVFKALKFLFIGRLKKYRAVDANDIAKCMIQLANSGEASKVVESDGI